MNLLVHHGSSVPASMTESLYEKVKREWVHHFQSLSLGGESSIELVAVATEPLTNASQLPMGWALHKRSVSVRFSQNVRQYLTQKFNIGRDTGRKQDPEQVAKDMRTACNIDGERMFDRTEWCINGGDHFIISFPFVLDVSGYRVVDIMLFCDSVQSVDTRITTCKSFF